MDGSTEDIYFEVILSAENMNIAKKEGLEIMFKLIFTIGTANMHLMSCFTQMAMFKSTTLRSRVCIFYCPS